MSLRRVVCHPLLEAPLGIEEGVYYDAADVNFDAKVTLYCRLGHFHNFRCVLSFKRRTKIVIINYLFSVRNVDIEEVIRLKMSARCHLLKETI